jgi:outer membrane lipoprotein-sorting protein
MTLPAPVEPPEDSDMKRIAFVAAAAAFVAGCASMSKPLTPAQMLVGTWTCQGAVGPSAKINGQMTYVAGGTTTFHINIAGGQGAFQIEAVGDGDGAWSLSPDNKQLTSSVTSLKIATAKLNGKDVGPALVQGMANQLLVGQSTTTGVTVTKTSLTLTGADGSAATTCTRPA